VYVSSTGVVTTKAVGTAKVSVTTCDTNKTGSITVTVTKPRPIPLPDSAKSIETMLYGVCFGPYLTEPNGAPLSDAFIKKLLTPVQGKVTWIRTYGCAGDLGKVPAIAKQMGFKTMVGAWIGSNLAANDREIAALKTLISNGVVDCALVGNEVLLRRDLSAAKLIDYINDVKAWVKNSGGGVPVSTAEPFNIYENNPQLVTSVDYIVFHVHVFWSLPGQPDKWLDFLLEKTRSMERLAKGKPIILGESGAPSARNGLPEAGCATPEIARKYLIDSITLMRKENIPYMVFSLYDERWKREGENGYGDAWGIYSTSMQLKYPRLYEALSDAILPPVDVAELSVPRLGTYPGYLTGRVVNIPMGGVKLAAYVESGSYFAKPTYQDKVTTPDANGQFQINMTTGGIDETLTHYALVILPGNITIDDVPDNSLPISALLTIHIYREADGSYTTRYERP